MKRTFQTLSDTHRGFTLINLLISLAISGLLVTAGIPSLATVIANNQADNNYQRLFTLIQFTRTQAVNFHSQVLMCPTLDEVHCTNDWNQSLMVFVDLNSDEIRNQEEKILQHSPSTEKNEEIKWNASGSQRYLRFKADGSTGNQNGRLTYCLKADNEVYSRLIIMYRSGRARRGSKTEAKHRCQQT